MPTAPPHAPAPPAANPIRRALAALTLSTAVTAAAACGTSTAPTQPGTRTGPHIAVAVVPITDAAPFILAVQRGYFTRTGLHDTCTLTPQSTAAAADLVHGTVNVIAAANYVSFLSAQAHGAINIRILAASTDPVVLQRVANLMAEGGMLTKPLNVAPLVLK